MTERAQNVDSLIFTEDRPPAWKFKHVDWKKKAKNGLLQCRTFFAEKKWGPQRKDFGGRYDFPVFHRVFASTADLDSFSLRPEKFLK